VFLGTTPDGLLDRQFSQCFQNEAEQPWLDLFSTVAQRSKHVYVDQVSDVIQRKLFTEAFHVEPDLCACIIHDFTAVPDAVLDSQTAELRRRANSDCLTGFYNRFYLRELNATLRDTDDVGIAYLDINGLKTINDAYGHSAGDERILKVAELLRTRFRDALLFRVGGDEFVVIATGTTRADFLALADAAHACFSESGLASIGYRHFEHVDDLQSCIDQCDTLMYAEKHRFHALTT
jgi:diguanylate cyclase (GGDEF)-like protein